MTSALPKFIIVALVSLAFQGGLLEAETLAASEWNVRCWNFDAKQWEDLGLEKMTVEKKDGVTKITNTSGIHKHAHLVFPAVPEGDFVFTIDVKGGYELGFLDRAGLDEMLYLELGEQEKFETFELSREGTRLSIKRNGRTVPLVHFRFDYGRDFVITLAIKDGESAEVRSYYLEVEK